MTSIHFTVHSNLLVKGSCPFGTSLSVFLKSHLPPLSNKLYALTQLLCMIPATTSSGDVTFLTVMLKLKW